MNGITNPAAAKLARRIESLMDDLRPAADSDPALAFASLLLGLHDVVDALDAMPILPPLTGGSPAAEDDFEELCPEFLAAPDEWPAYPHSEVDGWIWEPTAQWEGPTPLGVLQEDAPTWEPTADDLAEMASWSADLWTEADQVVCHGHA